MRAEVGVLGAGRGGDGYVWAGDYLVFELLCVCVCVCVCVQGGDCYPSVW
jgi:hypothetical protein